MHERKDAALDAVLDDWQRARQRHGLSQAVMIARDNATRGILNERARQLLIRDGTLGSDGVRIADEEFRLGDRVIARRNDRYRDVDNGTLARVLHVDRTTGEVTILSDAGQRRVLGASYAAEHLEHALRSLVTVHRAPQWNGPA